MKKVAWIPLALAATALVTATAAQSATQATMPLTRAEQAELDQRLADFYARPADPAAMNQRPPKFDARTGREIHPHPRLGQPASSDPILALAGQKALPTYSQAWCAKERAHHFKNPPCPPETKARVQRDDTVGDLVDSWLNPDDIVYALDDIPTNGSVAQKPWSDDYWRTQWGGLAYRYGAGVEYKTYDQAVKAYAQPDDWEALKDRSPADARRDLDNWSPAEKYDVTVGDQAFSLTQEQKHEGEDELEKGDVPAWIGLCDGWGAAAVMTPRPRKTVHTIGAKGRKVTWYPADIRALASLAWARGDYASNDVGGRCETLQAKTYANGRLRRQDCFDTNPATFHLALANMIGVARRSFIMDATFDAEVWNQPLVSYRFIYFNPLDIRQRSDFWRDVAVPYDDNFKDSDRFQDPLTRGKRSRGGDYDDSGIKKVVGVIAIVTFADEYTPNAGDDPADDNLVRATYTYDLELYKKNGTFVPQGGEWQSNAHPDFLWVPRADTQLTLGDDEPSYSIKKRPSADLTNAATDASGNGQPLCSVLTELLKSSSDMTRSVADLCTH